MLERTSYKLDGRSEADLRAELRRLAGSFTPEWSFNEEHPDIGSVIGLIFAGQMSDNISRMNRVLDKYHTEFINMLDLSLLPAYPASGVVVMELIEDTVPGLDLPAGTRLLSYNSEGAEPVGFETVADLHVTGARLREVFMAAPSAGKLIPLRGDFAPPVLEEAAGIRPEAEEAEAEAPAAPPLAEDPLAPGPPQGPMRLFSAGAPGIQRNALLLYHQTVFNTAAGVDVLMRLAGPGGEDLAPKLADPARYRWLYYAENELRPFAAVRAEGGMLHLSRGGEAGKLPLFGGQYALVCAEALGPVRETVQLGEVSMASRCAGLPAQFVSNNGQDLAPGKFLPFGSSASLFDECYIGHDEVFAQQGARVTLRFSLSARTKLVTMTPEQEEAELKVIKRRTSFVPFVTVDTSPQRVSFEYYNGTGWRRLPLEGDWDGVFSGDTAGEIELSFLCPEDWQPMAVGFEGRSIRLRILQADNCYLQPCRHTMPLLEGLTLSYAYTGGWKAPQRISRLRGTASDDLSAALAAGGPISAFAPLPYAEDALYLGFDRPIESGPVSLLFDIEDSGQFTAGPLRFETSTAEGFAPLKNVVDHTQNLTRTGSLVFMPPAGFAPRTLEGKRRWWLRITGGAGRPAITVRQILPNAVGVRNTETLDEEYFYVEAATPGMSFPLAARRILSAEVFVSEFDSLPAAEMQRMLAETPADVRAEYDYLGEIIEFYVRWQEVENFDDSAGRARHYVIDRQTSRIRFGNGTAAALPPVRSGVAFTVRCTCCSGEAGNLPAGAIDSFYGNVLYIDRVYNPAPTSAGSDIESLERAHRRGAGIISSKNRLVSEADFTREVFAASSAIHRVRCVIGQDPYGRKAERLVSLAVLLREYQNSTQAFEGLRQYLMERLLGRCEATLDEESLIICQPGFVTLTVDAWGRAGQQEDRFALRAAVEKELAEYIDPISGGRGQGWDIGTLPSTAQIGQMLYAAHPGLSVRHFTVTVRYTGKEGSHECELDRLPRSPFMLAVNGAHRLNFLD